MDKIVDVTGGKGGNAFLLVGKEKTALIDCGMAYCAPNLISNIKRIANSRALDYILISHSHYDHIGGIPYIREEWPSCKVLGAEYAKKILKKSTALQTIKSLSKQTADWYRGSWIDYDDNQLKVDDIIGDGDSVQLGDLHIKVIKTQGHTQCSLSFLVNNETLFASESTGYMSKTGVVYPAFLTSSAEAIESIHKCEQLKPQFIISPHLGLVTKEATVDYWKNCKLAVETTREFILQAFGQGSGEEEILNQYETLFRDEHSKLEQPEYAFRLNSKSMIKTVLKENSANTDENSD